MLTMTREEHLERLFSHCGDVIITRFITAENQPMLLVYCQGLVDLHHMQEVVIPQLDSRLSEGDLRALPISFLSSDVDIWVDRLFAGVLLLFLGELPPFAWDISSRPQRSTEDANTEVSIKGPRDGFIEDLSSNIALIRKRLRTLSLACEFLTLGTRSRSEVALLYMRDGTPPDIVETIRDRLISSSSKKVINSAILEQKLSDQAYSLFPLVDYSGRPDFVVFMLMEGKAVVLVDGSPVAIIAPVTLLELIKSPEDDQYPVGYVWLERILRLGGIWISVFLPGFWIALSAYNIEEFPFQLLATITEGRKGLPFSAPMELLGVLFIFEFLREAGARLPKTVGQTLALVGALIIGDASIRAGFTSPSMLFIGSLTVVASFTLINQSLSGAVTVARFFVFLLSAVVGTYGFVVSILMIIYYLSTLTSIGRPYLLLKSSNFLSTLFLVLFRPLISIFQRSSKKGRDVT